MSNKESTVLELKAKIALLEKETRELQAKVDEADFFRKIVDLLPCWIYYSDLDNRQIWANAYSLEMAGLSQEEARGCTYEELAIKMGVNPQNLAYAGQKNAEVLATKKPIYNIKEFAGVYADGKVHHAISNRIPIFNDKTNALEGVAGISFNTTELVEAQQEKKDILDLFGPGYDLQHAMLGVAIDQFPANIYWVDKNHITQGCNQRTLDIMGLTRDEYIGKRFVDIAKTRGMDYEQACLFKEQDQLVLDTGDVFVYNDDPVVLPNGKKLHFKTTRAPLRADSGEIIGVVGISELRQIDVTKANDIHESLKVNIISSAYHVLKSPIASVIDELNSVLDSPHGINRSALAAISDNLLSVAAMLEFDFELIEPYLINGDSASTPFCMVALLDDIKNSYFLLEKNNNVNVQLYITSNLPLINISKAAMHKLLTNIYENALKHTRNGNVLVSIERKDELLTINVNDDGEGLDPMSAKKIFELDFSRRKNGVKSFGYGLFWVKRLVENFLDGEVVVESGVGQGFNIIIKIPSAFRV